MLVLNSVSDGYGDFQALFEVSLEVKAGEAVAVIGPNGAGKSTLMRAISGMIPLKGGSVTMEGQRLSEVPPHKIVELGIAHVPENRRLFPRMSVEENLRVGSYAKPFRAKFAERLEFVYELFPRMKERLAQRGGTLSGGEQQ
ncbi:MAG: ATP-binding cassette domain-containing protein, partial [Alphaproteobacteria bacterium]